MKKVTFNPFCAMLVAIALSLAPAHRALAQNQDQPPHTVVPIKDSDVVQKVAAGNITKITPDAIFIKADGKAHPTEYTINANTTYVDDQGQPAQKANAKIDRAVIITYVKQGDTRVALNVHIRNAP